jgi:hypothetical protein
MRYSDIKIKKPLFEGGNVFKSPDGNSLTDNIKKQDIPTTIKWLEQITGLSLAPNLLGSAGRKSVSGDIDIGIDQKVTDKDKFYNILRNWADGKGLDPRDYIRKSGISVHFKCPINGSEILGHVQIDFMFSDNLNWLKFVTFGPGDSSKFSGADRYIAMSSLAKTLGLKLSQTKGLESRISGKTLTWSPEQVAKDLIGPDSKMDDLSSVETIISCLKRNHITGEELHHRLHDFIENIHSRNNSILNTALTELIS